jgi:L-cysteine/cystine lyase
VDFGVLRARFPVFERIAYLNSGTCGPVPRTAQHATDQVLAESMRSGRAGGYFDTLVANRERLRSAYAERIGAAAGDVSITTCTSEGIVRVLAGLDLRAGDEVVTADDEHPGLLGPLAGLRRSRGIEVRAVPLARMAEAVGPRTRLVACSHVSWVTGALAPAALAQVGERIPVLLDGAQGAGALGVDVTALGCAFYAAAGQKWLCGPVGTGMLWVSPAWRDRLAPLGPTLVNLAPPASGLDPLPAPDARAHDAFAIASEVLAAALAAHDAIGAAGWPAVHARACALAAHLAEALRERGRIVALRGDTTLVSWEDADPNRLVGMLADAGVVVRSLPGTPLVRASVGAWNDERDLERLLDGLT